MSAPCLSALLALGLMACSPSPAAGPTPASPEALTVLQATNAARQAGADCPLAAGGTRHYGPVPALRYNSVLEGSAQGYADDLAVHNLFPSTKAHLGSDGRSFDQRILAAGYQPGPSGAVGENVSGGRPTPQEAVAAWLASPQHCPNLLDPDFTEMGVGHRVQPGSTYIDYWVQDFGGR